MTAKKIVFSLSVVFCIIGVALFILHKRGSNAEIRNLPLPSIEDVKEELLELAQREQAECKKLFYEGKRLMKEGAYVMALKKFFEANEILTIPTTNYYIAIVYYKMDQKEEALTFFDKAIESWLLDDDNFDLPILSKAYAYKFVIYYQLKEWELSFANHEKAIQYGDNEVREVFKEIKVDSIEMLKK